MPQLNFTHEFIAAVLGLRRTYVTSAPGTLERHRLNEADRGMVTIFNRKRIELTACECYRDLRLHFQRLLPGVYDAQS